MDFPIFEVTKLIEVTEKTVGYWYNVFRQQIIKKHSKEADSTIFDDSQIDESLFAKRKYHVGRLVKQQWVFGICDANPGGEVFMYCVDKRNSSTLIPIIEKHTQDDSIVSSDCWRAYNQIAQKNRQHMTVNHSENFVDPSTYTTTNRIEGLWSSFKKWMKKHNYKCSNYLNDYIVEYCYRYNHQHSFGISGKIFSDRSNAFVTLFFTT